MGLGGAMVGTTLEVVVGEVVRSAMMPPFPGECGAFVSVGACRPRLDGV